MKLAIIGTGYVGLVTGACFAEMGNHVTCVDIDPDKINKLKQGIIPIYEQGLEEMIERNADEGRIAFATTLAGALDEAVACFIAVGTPPNDDGATDLTQVLAAAREIGAHLKDYLVVAIKSTVPVGTADKVRAEIESAVERRGNQPEPEFDVVSSPEFLAEGIAVETCMRPDRVILGTDSERAAAVMHNLYSPFFRISDRVIVMGVRDAELVKYAANAMLATRISFINEIAGICERLGADAEMVRTGIGADPRIGRRFLYPGAGFGGSCLPKDIKSLIYAAKASGFEPAVLDAVDTRNTAQKQVLFEKLHTHFDGELKGKTIAIWGLAFKPGTDDMREAPSLVLIERLIEAGAKVRAFDPVAKFEQGNGVKQVSDQYEALEGADALVLVTEWKQFRQPDFARIKALLNTPVIVDGRNQYDPAQLRESGFAYYAIGR